MTSKNTSINIYKLPAIYHKINWTSYKEKTVVDFGCGRPETQQLISKYLSKWNINYVPYDPYWCSDIQNVVAMDMLYCNDCDVLVSANVLNILTDKEFYPIIEKINDWSTECDIFISVYEGDKSRIQKQTKLDCWQRNLPTKDYWWLLKESAAKKGFVDWWNLKYGVIYNSVKNNIFNKGGRKNV